jgi:hypothetical protein
MECIEILLKIDLHSDAFLRISLLRWVVPDGSFILYFPSCSGRTLLGLTFTVAATAVTLRYGGAAASNFSDVAESQDIYEFEMQQYMVDD